MLPRVIAYIDGFNLYNGLKEADWKHYCWLNLRILCERLLSEDEMLLQVKYFTSKVVGKGSQERQRTYLSALRQVAGIRPIYGSFSIDRHTCNHCNKKSDFLVEKMTDVAIAVEMVADAYDNHYDTALLISADRDLAPAARRIKCAPLNKQIKLRFPPRRTCSNLIEIAHSYATIGEDTLRTSLLPLEITMNSGRIISCPQKWRSRESGTSR